MKYTKTLVIVCNLALLTTGAFAQPTLLSAVGPDAQTLQARDFVGTLEVTGDFPPVRFAEDFVVTLCHKSAPSLQELTGPSLVQLEFAASAVPWRLNEPEAE